MRKPRWANRAANLAARRIRTGSSTNASDTWPDQALLEVLHATEGVNHCAFRVDGQRVDRQVAPAQVFFDGHVGRGVELETVIAGGRFSLGPGEGVFFIRFRMQEHWKILADLFVAVIDQFAWCRTHNTPVPFTDRKPEPFITNGTTDEVHLHRAILASRANMNVTIGIDIRRVLLFTMCAFSLGGCYYMQAARGQLDVMSKREPIDDLISADATPEDLAGQLELVVEARQFAVDELYLPDNDSYRSYADLGRDYVVWNVFAAQEFSLQPRIWCFPIAGCVGYRGYFSEDSAERKAGRLRKEGYDVVVSGIPAYSTLGKFDDPVLNTMMHWTDTVLVATIFHELAHQVLYVKDDSEFNESFASAVEEIGIERWLASRNEQGEFDAYLERRDLMQGLIELVASARTELEALYASSLAPHEMRKGKERRLEQLRSELNAELERSGRDAPGWLDSELNNARLASMGLYQNRVAEFRALYEDCERDLQCFYDNASSLQHARTSTTR